MMLYVCAVMNFYNTYEEISTVFTDQEKNALSKYT